MPRLPSGANTMRVYTEYCGFALGSAAAAIGVQVCPPSFVSNADLAYPAAKQCFSSRNQTTEITPPRKFTPFAGLGWSLTFFQLRPASSVNQTPWSVTIHPELSFRRNSDRGQSIS